MKKFSQSRKSKRTVATVVHGSQVPLYGGLPLLSNAKGHGNKVALPLNLTFVLRSRAFILGRLVRSKFHKRVRCTVALTGQKLGKPHRLTNACVYHWMMHSYKGYLFGSFICHPQCCYLLHFISFGLEERRDVCNVNFSTTLLQMFRT